MTASRGARTAIALFVTVALLAQTQDASGQPARYNPAPPFHLINYTLSQSLESAREGILFLYTDYSSKTGMDFKAFVSDLAAYVRNVRQSANLSEDTNSSCRTNFETSLYKIEWDAQRAARFAAENHHKFLLGHMIVFRTHLNKSEEYIKKSKLACVSQPCRDEGRAQRFRRLAAEEISRVTDDMLYSRRFFKDIVAHARKKYNHLRKSIDLRTRAVSSDYLRCIMNINSPV